VLLPHLILPLLLTDVVVRGAWKGERGAMRGGEECLEGEGPPAANEERDGVVNGGRRRDGERIRP
jgi:hypothetical protein